MISSRSRSVMTMISKSAIRPLYPVLLHFLQPFAVVEGPTLDVRSGELQLVAAPRRRARTAVLQLTQIRRTSRWATIALERGRQEEGLQAEVERYG